MNAHFTIDHHAGRAIQINGSEYLFFGGTNYLGISSHEGFRGNLIRALEKYGTSHGASRNNNLRLSIFEEIENHFAEKYGFEAALVTSSGLLAGQLAAAVLPKKIIYAPCAHPAIVHPDHRYILKKYGGSHFDFSKKIIADISKIKTPFAIAANMVDNLKCEEINFTWINHLSEKKDITLAIDYSHGMGLLPIDEYILKAKNKFEIIVTASLAKAVGVPAGIVLGSKNTIGKIKKLPRFIGASPAAPAFLEAYLRSGKIYEEQYGKLISNISFFNQENKFPFRHLKNYPVYFSEKNMFEYMFRKNIFISSFSYPKPDDPPLSRVVLSAAHTFDDLIYLADKLS